MFIDYLNSGMDMVIQKNLRLMRSEYIDFILISRRLEMGVIGLNMR